MHARHARRLVVCLVALSLWTAPASAQPAEQSFEPQVGQPGKDVVWVPTPQDLVDMMLDMAKVTPQDYLIDLGSGDGRTVITAAKRGLRAHGIEYNPEMVTLAKRNASEAGLADKATFVQADLFESDFSKAQVVTMFLLPSINLKLRPTILEMKPGTRVVSNTFTMDDWTPDQSSSILECANWCTAHLWIVPAKVGGTWQMPQGTLTLNQTYQMVSGTLGSSPVSEGRLRGEEITFKVGADTYTGRVQGNTLSGTVNGRPWTATRR
jgi:precorrin-6B methylase 2